MNFAVAWEPDVRRELHSVWATAPDPKAVRDAADEIDRRLAADPYGSGRHLAEGLWRTVVPPLAVYYTIDPIQNAVVISDVAHIV